jgi:hypothetical protein
MKTNFKLHKISFLFLAASILTINNAFAQLNGFTLTPSGTTTNFMKFVPKGFAYNGTNYVTGYLTLSAYMNVTTQQVTDPGIPLQKFQIQGGNILLCRTNYAPGSPDINPTSLNGAILFSDMVTTENDWIHGKWGIEYDDQYSTGGLNIFKPKSSLTDTRQNFALFIHNEGNVGIGTGTPSAKLQVADGDIFIQDINKGIIMKSPDGRCWRGTMNNQGQLQFAELADCVVLSDNKPIEKPSTLTVYPNPTTNSLTIDLQKFENKTVSLRVINQSGQLLIEKSIPATKTYSLNVSSLSVGTYTLYVACANFNESLQFVKQ